MAILRERMRYTPSGERRLWHFCRGELYAYFPNPDTHNCERCNHHVVEGHIRLDDEYRAVGILCLSCGERLKKDRRNERLRLRRRAARDQISMSLHDAERWCATCGAEFVVERSDARYCSGACRQRTYRQRRRAG